MSTGDTVSIRAAGADDLPSVIGIVQGVLGEYELPVCAEELSAELRQVVAPGGQGQGRLWVALDGGRVVGCAAITPIREGVCELKRMYLLPAQRGRGVGRRLLGEALGYAREHYARVELETHTRMDAARGLYGSAGFQKFCSSMRNCGCDQSMYLDLQTGKEGTTES
jgi:putative acetyltransferase